MPRRRTLPVRERGFSLLEVMVALGILAVGVLGATAGQVAAMKLSSDSKAHGLALSLAEQQLEAFQATTLADVVAEIGLGTYPNDPNNPIMLDPGGGTPLAFERSWQIEQDTPETGVLRITVTVVWEDANGNDRSARVQSLKAAW
jgi:prepilin-type N-terminal cleavage/methylation domain-containing protein